MPPHSAVCANRPAGEPLRVELERGASAASGRPRQRLLGDQRGATPPPSSSGASAAAAELAAGVLLVELKLGDQRGAHVAAAAKIAGVL